MDEQLCEQWQTFSSLQLVIDAFSDPVFAKDTQHRWVAMNTAFCDLIGYSYAELFGKSDFDFWPAEQAQVFWDMDDLVYESQKAHFNEEKATDSTGLERTIWTRKFPLFDAEHTLIGLCGIITDITNLAQQRSEIEQLQQDVAAKMMVIEAQKTLLDQLTVPVIGVWEHVLLLPLVGSIDSRRAVNITSAVLEAIQANTARILIVDLTGVPVVDTAVAGHLFQTMQASRLLGCRSVLVGIRPEIAQTMVTLGLDFQTVTSFASLETGLQWAIHTIGLDRQLVRVHEKGKKTA